LKVFLPIVKISIQDFPSISFSIFQQRKIICKASCFQYHNCSCVVNSCVKIIFNQRKRNSATKLKQGRIFSVFYGLQRYFTNLYRPIGINFLFWSVSKTSIQSSLWTVNVCNLLVKVVPFSFYRSHLTHHFYDDPCD